MPEIPIPDDIPLLLDKLRARGFLVDRPVIMLDCEATGVYADQDRMTQFAGCKGYPDGRITSFSTLVNPERPIPAIVQEKTKITDAMVAAAPVFAAIARKLVASLVGCDLVTFNGHGFDLTLIESECLRANVPFDPETVRVLDGYQIFRKREPRDLEAALALYCGRTPQDAHQADGDAFDALRVFVGQLAYYPDLPEDPEGLVAFSQRREPHWIDRAGKVRWTDGAAVFTFGKHKGIPFPQIPRQYFWFVAYKGEDFSPEIKAIARDAHIGVFPQEPEALRDAAAVDARAS